MYYQCLEETGSCVSTFDWDEVTHFRVTKFRGLKAIPWTDIQIIIEKENK
jgi:hypothetical protein